MNPSSPQGSRRLGLALLLIFLLGLLHTLHTSFFVCDDAYISFRYAHNLAHHGELTYNLGEAVEGFSNLLWTVILALAALFTERLGAVALWLSALAALGTLAGTFALSQALLHGDPKPDATESAWPRWPLLLIPAALLAAWGPFTMWTAGGLETMLFTALITWSLCFTVRRKFMTAGLLWGLSALTRPEGAIVGSLTLFLASLPMLAASLRTRSLRPLLPALDAAALFTLMVGGLLLFRLHYYGEILPNTYYAKVSGIPVSFLHAHGRNYVAGFITTYRLPWLLLLLPGLLFTGRVALKRALPLAAIFLLWPLYVMHTGGDFMAMHRFFVPWLPVAVLLITLAIAGWGTMAVRLGRSPAVARNLVIYLGVAVALFLLHSSWRFEAKSIVSERKQLGMESVRGMINFAQDRVAVGRSLRKILGDAVMSQTVIAVGGAGAISYESRMGRAVDTFGLMDKQVATKRVKAGRFYKPGHLKQASWSYLKAQQPHILCSPGIATIGRSAPSKRQQQRVLAYFREYVYFCLRLPLSADDRGIARTHYCCIKQKHRFPQLTL